MKTKIILVAEDEEFNFRYIVELLSKSNYNILHAMNGKQAIEIFKLNDVDIILMDLKMPIMDGFEATRHIRSISTSVPIIAQTAYAYMKNDCMVSGFSDYIMKPFKSDRLIELLKQYTG